MGFAHELRALFAGELAVLVAGFPDDDPIRIAFTDRSGDSEPRVKLEVDLGVRAALEVLIYTVRSAVLPVGE